MLEPRIEELTSRLIDDFEADGGAEMVRQFAFPLPAQVMFSFIGFPEKDTEKLKSWCYDRLKISFGRPPPEEQTPAIERMGALFQYIEDFVRAKEGNLTDDYTSDLCRIGGETKTLLCRK
ncbi:MAG: hypothetical protein ACR2KW_04285 [Rubrobacter sp.]